jgi:hypothetical protein
VSVCRCCGCFLSLLQFQVPRLDRSRHTAALTWYMDENNVSGVDVADPHIVSQSVWALTRERLRIEIVST